MAWRLPQRLPLPPEEESVTSATIARGARYTAIAQIVTQVVRLGTNIVLARLLAPHDFGVVAIALVVTALLDQLKDVGTGSAIIQRRTVDRPLLQAVFYLNLALGAVLAVGLYAAAGPLARLLGDGGAMPVMQWFALVTMVTSWGQIHHALLRRELRFNQLAIVTCAAALVTGVVAITSALLGLTFWALVLGTGAGAVVNTVLVWHYSRWRPDLSLDLRQLRLIWGYSFNLFLSNIVFFAFNQADKMIVSRALGAGPLGAYTLAQRTVTSPMQAVSTVVNEVTFPAFSRLQDDNAALRAGFLRSSRVMAFVTLPAAAGLAVLAAPVVAVVFGPQWRQLVPLIHVLAPMGAVVALTGSAAQLLMAKGRSDWSLRWSLASSLVVVIAEIIGVRWGLAGVALGFAIGSLVMMPFGLKICFSLVDLRLRDYCLSMLPQVLLAAATAAAAGAGAWGARQVGGAAWSEVVMGVGVGVGVFAVLVLTVRPPVARDLMTAVRQRGR